MGLPDFRGLLRLAMKQRDLSQLALAKRLGLRQSVISLILAGKRLPPRRHLTAMARELGLTGGAAAEFVLAGEILHAPEVVREYLRELEATVDRLGGKKPKR